jgi:PPM family protein phosphatase
MKVIGQSRKGVGEGPNEDAIGWDEERCLALLADGMGGYASGEVASGIVKDTLLERDPVTTDLADRVLSAHERISRTAAENPAFAGMGSTVVAFTINDRVARIVWVGDSRAYLWRGRRLRQLTRDHSAAEYLRVTEQLSETAIRRHPLQHMVLQALGKEVPDPSIKELALRRGDWLILCSDGLTGSMSEQDMNRLLRAAPTMSDAAESLVATAFNQGSEDDISIVIAEHTGGSRFGFDWHPSPRAALWLSILAGVLGAIVLMRIARLLLKLSH